MRNYHISEGPNGLATLPPGSDYSGGLLTFIKGRMTVKFLTRNRRTTCSRLAWSPQQELGVCFIINVNSCPNLGDMWLHGLIQQRDFTDRFKWTLETGALLGYVNESNVIIKVTVRGKSEAMEGAAH